MGTPIEANKINYEAYTVYKSAFHYIVLLKRQYDFW